MIANGDNVYIVQINMADPGQNPEWDNVNVYQGLGDAERQIDWMLGEYGDNIEYRINTVQIFTTA